MTDGDTAAERRRAALRDLRAVEATRVLGLLDETGLADRARRWVDSGIDTPAARALAAGPGPAATAGPAVLVATLAAEHGVAIHDVHVARAIHSQTVIAMSGRGTDFSDAVFQLSNSVTDRATGGLRRWWARRRSR